MSTNERQSHDPDLLIFSIAILNVLLARCIQRDVSRFFYEWRQVRVGCKSDQIEMNLDDFYFFQRYQTIPRSRFWLGEVCIKGHRMRLLLTWYRYDNCGGEIISHRCMNLYSNTCKQFLAMELLKKGWSAVRVVCFPCWFWLMNIHC